MQTWALISTRWLHNPKTSPHPMFHLFSALRSTLPPQGFPPSPHLIFRPRLSFHSAVSLHSPLISCSPPPPLAQSNGSMYLLAHCRWLGWRFEPKDERTDPVMRILMQRNCLALTDTHMRAHTHTHTHTHTHRL